MKVVLGICSYQNLRSQPDIYYYFLLEIKCGNFLKSARYLLQIKYRKFPETTITTYIVLF